VGFERRKRVELGESVGCATTSNAGASSKGKKERSHFVLQPATAGGKPSVNLDRGHSRSGNADVAGYWEGRTEEAKVTVHGVSK